jgi:hypothetical protein
MAAGHGVAPNRRPSRCNHVAGRSSERGDRRRLGRSGKTCLGQRVGRAAADLETLAGGERFRRTPVSAGLTV